MPAFLCPQNAKKMLFCSILVVLLILAVQCTRAAPRPKTHRGQKRVYLSSSQTQLERRHQARAASSESGYGESEQVWAYAFEFLSARFPQLLVLLCCGAATTELLHQWHQVLERVWPASNKAEWAALGWRLRNGQVELAPHRLRGPVPKLRTTRNILWRIKIFRFLNLIFWEKYVRIICKFFQLLFCIK